MKKILSGCIAAATMTTAGVLGVAGTAQAVDINICVGVYGPPAVQSSILLWNQWCNTTVRVKIIEANGPDSGCFTLAPGGQKTWNRPWYSVGTYDGLRSC